MRKNLLLQVSLKLVVCYIISIFLFLLVCIIPFISKPVGVLIMSIDLIYTIYVIYSSILQPLSELVKAVEPIDFKLDKIDFTKLDNLEYSKENEVGVLVHKFKDLSEVLVARVDRVNAETYKSEHDGLSGLYNRVKYQKSKTIYAGCKNVCIIYIDVNNLKKMNDIFGHEAGDVLIRKAAQKLSFWEDYGDVYRMGGDEFMVVITNKTEDECNSLIDIWYPTVGCLNRRDDGFKCMMAYGVSFGGMYSDTDELIKQADERMYYHKIEIKKANGEDPNSR